MIPAMDRVGQAIRSTFHWIPPNQTCYLVINNAGGHGTDEAIKKYTTCLLDKHKIEIIKEFYLSNLF